MIFFPGLRPDINSLLTFMGEFHFDPAKTMVNWASNGLLQPKLAIFGSF